jgi:hydrogenase maturation factor
MHRSAMELGISLVGGHTEIVSRLKENIAVVTQIGISNRKPLDIREIKDGDLLLQVNEAGIEGTAVIAYDHPDLIVQFDEGGLELAMSYMEKVSVVRDALRLSELGVRAMHDPTEGGLIGGAVEMAVASGLSLEVDYDKVLISPITRSICEHLNLDPLKLLSSGSVLAAADRQVAERVLVEYGERASIIGRFTSGPPGLVLIRNGRRELYTEPPQDEIYRLI